jgi:hypothetical protein
MRVFRESCGRGRVQLSGAFGTPGTNQDAPTAKTMKCIKDFKILKRALDKLPELDYH